MGEVRVWSDRKWKSFRLKEKQYHKKHKNNILYPDTNKTLQELSTDLELLTEMFEYDRPKSMEWPKNEWTL